MTLALFPRICESIVCLRDVIEAELDELVVKRKACGSAARIDAQFAIDRLRMAIHRVRTQDQLLGDLKVARSLCQEA